MLLHILQWTITNWSGIVFRYISSVFNKASDITHLVQSCLQLRKSYEVQSIMQLWFGSRTLKIHQYFILKNSKERPDWNQCKLSSGKEYSMTLMAFMMSINSLQLSTCVNWQIFKVSMSQCLNQRILQLGPDLTFKKLFSLIILMCTKYANFILVKRIFVSTVFSYQSYLKELIYLSVVENKTGSWGIIVSCFLNQSSHYFRIKNNG